MSIKFLNLVYQKQIGNLTYTTIVEIHPEFKFITESLKKMIDLGDFIEEISEDSQKYPDAQILVWEDARRQYRLAKAAELTSRRY